MNKGTVFIYILSFCIFRYIIFPFWLCFGSFLFWLFPFWILKLPQKKKKNLFFLLCSKIFEKSKISIFFLLMGGFNILNWYKAIKEIWCIWKCKRIEYIYKRLLYSWKRLLNRFLVSNPSSNGVNQKRSEFKNKFHWKDE